jgi:chaperone BCS1
MLFGSLPILMRAIPLMVCSLFLLRTVLTRYSSQDWVMYWLSLQPSWKTAREVQVCTRGFGLGSSATLVPGEDVGPNHNGSRPLGYLPTVSTSYTMWYNWHLMCIQRVQSQTGYYGGTEETLQLRYVKPCIAYFQQRNNVASYM